MLRELEILVDGDHDHAYMLQIFLKESAGLYGDRERRAVLLRDHPAQGRPGLRRRQLPRAVREHRARAAEAREAPSDARADRSVGDGRRGSTTSSCAAPAASCATRSASRATASTGPYTILYHQRRPHTQRVVEPRSTAGPRRSTPPSDARARASATTSARTLKRDGRRADRRARRRCCSTTTSSLRRRVPDRARIRSTSPTATPTSCSTSTRAAARCARCSATCASSPATTCSCRAACSTASCPTRAPQYWLSIELHRRRCTSPSSGATRSASCAWTRRTAHRDFKRPSSRARSTRASASWW